MKIFQEFTLIPEEGFRPAKEAGKKLMEELRNKGYTLLLSDECYCGVPTRLMIGAELNHDSALRGVRITKENFYEIVGRLGLLFEQGEWYREE